MLFRCLSTPYTHRGTVSAVVSTETTITTHTTTAREGTIRDSNVVFSRTADPLKSTPWGFAMLGCSLVTISLVTLNFGACWGGFQSVLLPLNMNKTHKTRASRARQVPGASGAVLRVSRRGDRELRRRDDNQKNKSGRCQLSLHARKS